jgi:hypothetical protein
MLANPRTGRYLRFLNIYPYIVNFDSGGPLLSARWLQLTIICQTKENQNIPEKVVGYLVPVTQSNLHHTFSIILVLIFVMPYPWKVRPVQGACKELECKSYDCERWLTPNFRGGMFAPVCRNYRARRWKKFGSRWRLSIRRGAGQRGVMKYAWRRGYWGLGIWCGWKVQWSRCERSRCGGRKCKRFLGLWTWLYKGNKSDWFKK